MALNAATNRGISLFNALPPRSRLDLHRPAPLNLQSPSVQQAEVAAEPAVVPHAMDFPTPVTQSLQSLQSSQHSQQKPVLHPLPATVGNVNTINTSAITTSSTTNSTTNTTSSTTNSTTNTITSTVSTITTINSLQDSVQNDPLLSVSSSPLSHNQPAVFAWGNNSLHQLGVASDLPISSHPLQLSTLSVPHAFPLCVSAGSCHTLCLTDETAVFAWGNNQYGQLGLGANHPDTTIPQCVEMTGASQA